MKRQRAFDAASSLRAQGSPWRNRHRTGGAPFVHGIGKVTNYMEKGMSPYSASCSIGRLIITRLHRLLLIGATVPLFSFGGSPVTPCCVNPCIRIWAQNQCSNGDCRYMSLVIELGAKPYGYWYSHSPWDTQNTPLEICFGEECISGRWDVVMHGRCLDNGLRWGHYRPVLWSCGPGRPKHSRVYLNISIRCAERWVN